MIDASGAPAPDRWTLDQALRPVSHILRHGIEPPWSAPTEIERGNILRHITPIDGRLPASARSHVAFCLLPWYPDAALVRVVDPAWGDASIYFLQVDNRLLRLDGASISVHEANIRAPLRLTRETVLEYLKFFCFFVRGADGPFYLLERGDHPILTFEIDEETQDKFDTLARPPRCDGQNESGDFLCSGIVFYDAAISRASFAVQQSGMVEMLDDDPIETNLPVRFSATLGAPAR